jgi:DAK2 domain fusion protein YloV
VLQVLDADALRRWCSAALAAFEAARAEIDDLNVYPVPDGDTGTNLVLTMQSVAEAVQAAAADLAATVAAVSRGGLLGARGNSGVILSQLLRGFGEALVDGPGDGATLVRGLARASALADAAVATPVEGTILTVAREAARGGAAAAGGSLVDVVRAARAAAEEALHRTTSQLPQLAAAGVVDAGGRGLCVLLEALEAVVTGIAVTATPAPVVPRGRSGLLAARESGSEEFAYEVQYLLRDSSEAAVALLKEQLAALGDSLVVVGVDELWNVHVHVNDVGAALEAGVQAGTPSRVTVTRFEDQVAEDALPVMNERPATRAVVAVAAGAGLIGLFQAAGAQVVDGGPTANPSTAQLLQAVRRSGAREVVLLPNDGNVHAVARAAAQEAGRDGLAVRVVPTRSVVQGLAALAVLDEAAPLDDAVAAMTEAASGTRYGEVTTAVREATTSAGICLPGDALGLLGGTVVVVGAELEWATRRLLDLALADGGDLLTLVLGAAAPDGLGDRLCAHVSQGHPQVEVVVYEGGQPHYPVLVGVE